MSTSAANSFLSEEEKYHQRKMQAIGTVVGKIAHDLNNYLTVITGFSELVMMELQNLGRSTNTTEQIQRAAEQIAALARRFQVYSRRAAGRTGRADLHEVLRSHESYLKSVLPDSIALQLDFASPTSLVDVDPELIPEVLQILVANSCEAMPKGGNLRIQTSYLPEKESPLRSVTEGPAVPAVLLSMSDDGMGMTDQVKEHLYEPFFTTKEGHKGFGLFTVFGLLQKVKGFVRIYSESEKGTTVQIFFPQGKAT